MIVYRCDKCGKVYEWYEQFYRDKKFNGMSYRELREWEKAHPDVGYAGSPADNFGWNCIHLQQVGPINDNMSTNDGVLDAEVTEGESNNELLMFCQDCMSDFINGLSRRIDV